MQAPLHFRLPEGMIVEITHDAPSGTHYTIPCGTHRLTTWGKSYMLEQTVARKDIGFFMLSLVIEKPIHIAVGALEHFAAVQYTLKGNATAWMKGFGLVYLMENTYTPLYIPAGQHAVWFEKGEYAFFYMLLEENHLEELAASQPLLLDQLKTMQRRTEKGMLLDRLLIDNKIIDQINHLYDLWPDKLGIYWDLHELRNELLRLYNKELFQRDQHTGNISPDELIQRACMYIVDHIHLSDRELVLHLKSKSSLYNQVLGRYFKKTIGQSLRSYVKDHKMNRSFYLLLSDNYSITEVAEQLGFYDLYSFSKQFSQYYGFSPKHVKDHYLKMTDTN